MKTIPAGIEWKPIRRNNWLVTVRREPEVIYDIADLPGLSLSQLDPKCPCCGRSTLIYGNANGGNFGLSNLGGALGFGGLGG